MGAQLTLHLGTVTYNWANPNVRNRPGSATAPPSNQVQMAPAQNWGWANVGNTGDTAANATVTYYYCTPGGPVDKWQYFLGNQYGTATLPVPANDTTGQQATSNGSWQLTVHAHTCMIAVVQAPNDQLPPGFMDPDQAPEIGDRHVGQQNLTIVTAPSGSIQTVRFRAPEQAGSTLRVTRGDGQGMAAQVLGDAAGQGGAGVDFGFVGDVVRDLNAPSSYAAASADTDGAANVAGGLDEDELGGGATRELTVQEGDEGFRDLVVRVPADAQPGSHDFLAIETVRDGRVVAGLGVLVQVE